MLNKYTLLLINCFSLFISFSQKEITNKQIWSDYTFYSKTVEGFRSMNDGERFTRLVNGDDGNGIIQLSFTDYNETPKTIVQPSDLKYNNETQVIDDYFFNADETQLLLATKQQFIYRHSYVALFYTYNLSTKKLEPLDRAHSPQTLAEFSPDGKKVAYIFDNNIYVKDLASGNVTQITKDGERNKIINGTTDWVYEEEFAVTKGFYWSPDSKKIAFLRFDESKVKTYTLEYYSNLYPDIFTYKYPKAGEDNSKVELYVHQLDENWTNKVALGEYEYVPRLKYSPINDQLVVLTMNRHQDDLKYHIVDCSSDKLETKTFYTETSDTYIDIDDNLLFLKDGKSVLRTSEKDGYNHIYEIGFDGKINQITSGNWDVIELKGINLDKNLVYYTSAQNGPTQQDLYVVSLKKKNIERLSTQTGHTDADFSTGMKYYIQNWSNANTPEIYTLHEASGKELFVLENNSKLVEKLKEYQLPEKTFLTIKGAGGENLNAWMIKPPHFDPSKKYPVYINIYGGPGHNTVLDAWDGANYMYHQLLAQKGYIVFSVDPRGTMYQGAKFKKLTYLQLGKLELEDFVAVAKELKTRSYVDSSRVGIQGWSYGGYMTLLSMTKGAPNFKMGIAVAPVTNWRYYDNIYTERFMRTPAENASGYDDNSPINFTDDLKGKLFIVHGTGDDNVHVQNTMEMVNALIKSDKKFDSFFFPNRNHGIYGGNTREYLFNMLLDYTLKNL